MRAAPKKQESCLSIKPLCGFGNMHFKDRGHYERTTCVRRELNQVTETDRGACVGQAVLAGLLGTQNIPTEWDLKLLPKHNFLHDIPMMIILFGNECKKIYHEIIEMLM